MIVRWPTFEPGVAEEERQRAAIESRIDLWWGAFRQRAAQLDALFDGHERWDLSTWMNGTLQAIDPNLMWEFGPGLRSGHRLVITPESDHHLRPLVHQIVSRAPALDGWEFYEYRLAENISRLDPILKGRTGAPWLGGGSICSPGDANRVDILFGFPGDLLARDRELAEAQAFVACETLLGEENLDHWVGGIDVAPVSNEMIPIDAFKISFDEARSQVLDQGTYPVPLADTDGKWALYELKPKGASDYPRQTDLFIGKAMHQVMWCTAHSDTPFSSRRFSRFGERFCYLKLDGMNGFDGSDFDNKGEVEDALDDELRQHDLGCFIGGGTGYRYSYVDLALTNLDAAIPRIREVLRAHRIQKRTWLQFFDTDWQTEWVGIWPDTPPPPMVESADA